MLLTVIPALRSDLRTHEAENQENFSTGGLEAGSLEMGGRGWDLAS